MRFGAGDPTPASRVLRQERGPEHRAHAGDAPEQILPFSPCQPSLSLSQRERGGGAGMVTTRVERPYVGG